MTALEQKPRSEKLRNEIVNNAAVNGVGRVQIGAYALSTIEIEDKYSKGSYGIQRVVARSKTAHQACERRMQSVCLCESLKW